MKTTLAPRTRLFGRMSRAISVDGPSWTANGSPTGSSCRSTRRTARYNGMTTVVGSPAIAWKVARLATASPSPPVRAYGQHSAARCTIGIGSPAVVSSTERRRTGARATRGAPGAFRTSRRPAIVPRGRGGRSETTPGSVWGPFGAAGEEPLYHADVIGEKEAESETQEPRAHAQPSLQRDAPPPGNRDWERDESCDHHHTYDRAESKDQQVGDGPRRGGNRREDEERDGGGGRQAGDHADDQGAEQLIEVQPSEMSVEPGDRGLF